LQSMTSPTNRFMSAFGFAGRAGKIARIGNWRMTAR